MALKKAGVYAVAASPFLASRQNLKSAGRSACMGLPGNTARLTSASNNRPVRMAINMDSAMKASVHGSPINAIRIRVNEKEFQGLAIKNAMTWPMLAPRS